jgi:hypothetical protein
MIFILSRKVLKGYHSFLYRTHPSSEKSEMIPWENRSLMTIAVDESVFVSSNLEIVTALVRDDMSNLLDIAKHLNQILELSKVKVNLSILDGDVNPRSGVVRRGSIVSRVELNLEILDCVLVTGGAGGGCVVVAH